MGAQGCQDAAVDSETLGNFAVDGPTCSCVCAPVASAFLPRSWGRLRCVDARWWWLMRRWVQDVKEITPRWLQLKSRPAAIEAQGADDASPISNFAGALVRAVESGPPGPPPSPPFLCSGPLLSYGTPLLSVTLSLSFPLGHPAKTENRYLVRTSQSCRCCGAQPLA